MQTKIAQPNKIQPKIARLADVIRHIEYTFNSSSTKQVLDNNVSSSPWHAHTTSESKIQRNSLTKSQFYYICKQKSTGFEHFKSNLIGLGFVQLGSNQNKSNPLCVEPSQVGSSFPNFSKLTPKREVMHILTSIINFSNNFQIHLPARAKTKLNYFRRNKIKLYVNSVVINTTKQ